MEIKLFPHALDPCREHVFAGVATDPNVTPPTTDPVDNDTYLVEDGSGNVIGLWKYDASAGVWREIKVGGGCTTRQAHDTYTATAGQTAFTLSQTPSGDVVMARNGVTLATAAMSAVGTTATYDPAGNASIALLAGDRVDLHYVWEDCSVVPPTGVWVTGVSWTLEDELFVTLSDGTTQTLPTAVVCLPVSNVP